MPALPNQFARQVQDLADVVVGVGGAVENDGETIFAGDAGARVGRAPIVGGLFANRCLHHFYRVIKIRKRFQFGRWFCFRKFARAIALVACLRDLRTDVIVEIAGEMQNQMTDAVAVREWIFPELFFCERRDSRVQVDAEMFVVFCEASAHCFR
jgi:hypothetical protein